MRLDWIFLPREKPCAKFYIIIIIIIIIIIKIIIGFTTEGLVNKPSRMVLGQNFRANGNIFIYFNVLIFYKSQL